MVFLSDRVQCNYSYFGWGPVLREIPQGTPLIFDLCELYAFQIQNGSLTQFPDDTCLICYGGDHTQVKDFLSSDLDSLARYIYTSKMQVNVEKSCAIWFSFKSFNSLTTVLPICWKVLLL